MTIGDWIARRSDRVPTSLHDEIVDAVGADIERSATDVGRVCLTAATRVLESLLHDRAYGRDSAARLLAADALTALAFEHAAASHMSAADLASLASDAARLIGSLIERA